eukprot:gene2727-5373_t
MENIVSDSLYTSTRVEIALKPVSIAAQKQIPANLKFVIQNEYATKYLEKIGVTPSKENIDFVLANFPIKDALVVPAWTRETLVIVADRGHEPEQKVMHDLYSTKKSNISNSQDKESFHNKSVTRHQSTSEDLLKKSFLKRKSFKKLPAVSKQSYESMPSKYDSVRRISRKPVNTLNILDSKLHLDDLHELVKPNFKKLLHPLHITDDNISAHIANFTINIMDHIPHINDNKYENILQPIKDFLLRHECIRFYGLLAHFSYWNILHPFSRRILNSIKILDLNTSLSASNNYDNIDLNSISHQTMTSNIYNHIDIDNDSSDNNECDNGDETKYDIYQQNIFDSSAMGGGGSTTSTRVSLSSETSLTQSEKEVLYVQLEECLQSLRKEIGFNTSSQTIAQHALLACCHSVVDDVLLMHYVWLRGPMSEQHSVRREQYCGNNRNNSDGGEDYTHHVPLHLQIRRVVHHAMSDILDPFKVYAASLLIPSLGKDGTAMTSVAAGMHRTSKVDRGRYFVTSSAVRALFSGDSAIIGSEDVRRFLWMSREHNSTGTAVNDTIPGFPKRTGTAPTTAMSPSRRMINSSGSTRSTSSSRGINNNFNNSNTINSPNWRASTASSRVTEGQGEGDSKWNEFAVEQTERFEHRRAGTQPLRPMSGANASLDFRDLFASAERVKTASRTTTSTLASASADHMDNSFPSRFKNQSQSSNCNLEVTSTMRITGQEIEKVSTETKAHLMRLMVNKTKQYYTDKKSGHPTFAYHKNHRIKLLSLASDDDASSLNNDNDSLGTR